MSRYVETRKKGVFWKVYTFLLIASIIAIGYGMFYLWGLMEEYEASTPEYALAEIPAIYSIENFENLDMASAISSNTYENIQIRKSLYQEKLNFGEISYARLVGGDTENSRTYVVRAGEENLGEIQLVFEEGGNFGSWNVQGEKIYLTQWGEVHFIAPSTATILINGVSIIPENLTVENIKYPNLKNLHETIEQPTRVQYSVYGFYSEPVIEIFDAEGNPLEFSVSDTLAEQMTAPDNRPVDIKLTEDYTIKYYASDISAKSVENDELEEMIWKDALNYSQFVTADKTFNDIASRFIVGTEIYDDLIYLDTQFNDGHISAEMKDEVLSNMLFYNDNLFSVELDYLYELEMYQSEPREQQVSIRLIYTKEGDTWKICDLQIK